MVWLVSGNRLSRPGFCKVASQLLSRCHLPSSTAKRFESQWMKAVYIEEFGAPRVLKLDRVRRPCPTDDQVLVKVHSAGINPVDIYIREGVLSNRAELPMILGKEVAGTVEQVGARVSTFKVGDRVTCCLALNGGYAEYVCCDESLTFHLPHQLSFSQGATLYVAYFSALRALVTKCGLRRGERVLIHGASGAVGVAAVQIAVSLGAEVSGTAGTPGGMDLVKSLGACTVLDHRSVEYEKNVTTAARGDGGYHVILENCAHLNLGLDLRLLAPGGRIAVVGTRGPVEVDPRFIIGTEARIYGINLFAVTQEEFGEYVRWLERGVDQGFISPHIAQEYPLTEAPAAHSRLTSRLGARGKLVFKLV